MKKILLLVLVAISTDIMAETAINGKNEKETQAWIEYCKTTGYVANIAQTMNQLGKTPSEAFETLLPIAKALHEPELVEKQINLHVNMIKAAYKVPVQQSTEQKKELISAFQDGAQEGCMKAL